tara:strand:- start:151 stop:660 length:510 start_codon:yes stop_codon:yes gene_type:complete
MIELQKEDIDKLDLLLEVISENGFFGLNWKHIEEKETDFFNKVNPKNLIDARYSDHNAREYERLASFFIKYNCGNVQKATAFTGEELTISKNKNSLQFKKQGGFKNLYTDLKEEKKRKNIEFKKSKVDLKLANKMLEEFPKTKLFSRVGAFIGIILLLKELYILIWKPQ